MELTSEREKKVSKIITLSSTPFINLYCFISTAEVNILSFFRILMQPKVHINFVFLNCIIDMCGAARRSSILMDADTRHKTRKWILNVLQSKWMHLVLAFCCYYRRIWVPPPILCATVAAVAAMAAIIISECLRIIVTTLLQKWKSQSINLWIYSILWWAIKCVRLVYHLTNAVTHRLNFSIIPATNYDFFRFLIFAPNYTPQRQWNENENQQIGERVQWPRVSHRKKNWRVHHRYTFIRERKTHKNKHIITSVQSVEE